MATTARFRRKIFRRGWRRAHMRRFDGVLAVTIRANWRVIGAARDGCAMHALGKLRADLAMALAAGLRNIKMIRRRSWIIRGENFMTAVTTAARRRAVASGKSQTSVNAAAVGLKWIFDGNMMLLHQIGISVTARTSESKLPRINP